MNKTVLALAGLLTLGFCGIAKADVAAAAATPATPTAKALSSTAKPSPWKNTLVASLNLSQAHYSNWTAGGANSLSWIGELAGSSTLTDPLDVWASNLKLAFGESTIGSQEQKVADAIHVDSTYTQTLNKYVNPFVGATWDTQFDTGYNYAIGGVVGDNVPVSQFQDPGYLVESVGVGSQYRDMVKIRIGAAARQTFAEGSYDTITQYTPNGEAVYDQYGVSGMLGLKFSLSQNLLFTSELDIFSNLKSMDDVDGTWNNMLTGKINGWLSANLNCDAIYNNIQSTAGQFYEGLSLTFSYNLI
ncbi:MAG: DUF3078 domain-containing protein [bacterium]